MGKSVRFTVPPSTTDPKLPDLDGDRDFRVLDPGEGVDWAGSDSARLGGLCHAFTICRLLAHDELTLLELAQQLELSARTVRRYIYAIQLAGIDIVVRQSRRRYQSCFYRLDTRSWHGLLSLPRD